MSSLKFVLQLLNINFNNTLDIVSDKDIKEKIRTLIYNEKKELESGYIKETPIYDACYYYYSKEQIYNNSLSDDDFLYKSIPKITQYKYIGFMKDCIVEIINAKEQEELFKEAKYKFIEKNKKLFKNNHDEEDKEPLKKKQKTLKHDIIYNSDGYIVKSI